MAITRNSTRITRRDVLATAGLAALFGQAGRADAQTGPTKEERSNLKVISDFIAAWNARDAGRVASFLAADARFSAGRIGKFAPLRAPVPLFADFISRTRSIKMTVKPHSTSARGPMVTHERVDEMTLLDGTNNGSGTFFAVFGLIDRKIVDFIDFQID